MAASVPAVGNAVESFISSAVSEVTGKVGQLAEQIGTTATVEGAAVHSGSQNAVAATQNPTEVAIAPNATEGTTDDFFSCAYEVGPQGENIERMVYLGNVHWPASATIFQTLWIAPTPKVFYNNSTLPLHGQVGYFSYMRTGYHFRLQFNPPAGAQGAVVLSWAPSGIASFIPEEGQVPQRNKHVDPYTYFNLPYAILNLNTSTEVSLTVPFVHDTNYVDLVHYPLDARTGGVLFIWVLAPFLSNGGTTSNGTVFGSLMDLDLQGPRPWTNEGRRRLRRRQALPPPEPPKEPRQIIQPGPGAWNASNALVNTSAESTALVNESTAIDMATAGCNAAETDLVDVLKRWSIIWQMDWPMNKNQSDSILKFDVNFRFGNFWGILDKFQFWRGSLEFKLMVFGSKFTQGRYMLSWYPTRNNFDYAEARNSLFVISDINGPQPTLVIPFTYKSWRKRTEEHYGTMQVFVVNSLVMPADFPTTVKCVLFCRAGSDFQLFCPKYGSFEFTKLEGTDEQLNDDTEPTCFLNFDIQPVSITSRSHSLLSSVFGRAWFDHYVEEAEPGEGEATALLVPKQGIGSLMSYYAYFSGELVITFMNDSERFAVVCHTYEDLWAATEEPSKTGLHLGELSAAGMVIVPPHSIKNMAVPFYSLTPLRRTTDKDCFGYLWWYAALSTNVFLAIRNGNFFFKIPVAYSEQTTYPTTRRKIKVKLDNSLLPPEVAKDVSALRMRGTRVSALRQLFCDQKGPLELEPWRPVSAQKLLVEEGIEPNPGPQLVFQDRALYKHYGVKIGEKVFHINTDNIFKTILSGEVQVVEEPASEKWHCTGEYEESLADYYVKSGVLPEFKFSCHENCETWAREIIGNIAEHQGHVLLYKLMCCVALGFFTTHILMDSQSGIGDAVQGLLSKISTMVFGSFENEAVRIVIRTVIRIICYLILYIHSPNLLTTGVLAALLVMDATSVQMDKGVKDMCQALIEGDFHAFCDYFLAALQMEDGWDPNSIRRSIPKFKRPFQSEMTSESSPKTFNDWSTCAKNIQWWIESLMKVFKWIKEKIFPPEMADDVRWLEENRDMIALLFALCDEHLCTVNTDKTYLLHTQNREKHKALTDMLSGTLLKTQDNIKMNHLTQRASYLLSKMQNVTFEPELNWKSRPEPLGVWISGSAGVGKSFLSNYIVKKVSKHFRWNSYANATGSNHMDGYTSQEIHVFDDFGQQRDEEDYSLICNLISSVPFIVPKADVSTKGTPYNGKLVVITTNRNDFNSSKLFDPAALSRRFPICLKIRPRTAVTSPEGRLDVTTAMRLGCLKNGQCWQRDLNANKVSFSGEEWVNFDAEMLVQEIIKEIELRMQTVDVFESETLRTENANQVPDDIFRLLRDDEPEFDFERFERQAKLFLKKPKQTKLQKFRQWVDDAIQKTKQFLEKHRAWIIGLGAIGTVISLASLIFPNLKEKAQAWYHGQPSMKKVPRNYKVLAEKHVKNLKVEDHESQNGELNMKHICQRLVLLERDDGAKITGLAVGGKSVLTFGHEDFVKCVQIKEEVVDFPIVNSWAVRYNDEVQDLQQVELKMPNQFKDVNHLIYDGAYEGNGFLLWKTEDAYFIQEVTNIRPWKGIKTVEGHESSYIYLYQCRSQKGYCGGVLIANVQGNPKILGIHTSGNGVTGSANRVFPVFKDQGQATLLAMQENPFYYQPRKSALKPSPFYFEPNLEPAVLSKNDPRLLEPVDDITVKAAQKYVGNVFDPPPTNFQVAMTKLGEDFSKVLGCHKVVNYVQATQNEFLPIDWQTSPGHKYTGKKKAELIALEDFKMDVESQMENPVTYFTTYLKDELRPKSKVSAGKTRAIEAANFDYVIAFRQVMGEIYNQIYRDRMVKTGIAVGMNVFTDYDVFVESLNAHCLCLDFSGFDGSLSPQLMRAAVEVFSWFHEDPDLVFKIHEPTIESINLVGNQIWAVSGGMCSGSPCTSVLNSAVNLLACYTVFVSLGYQPEEIRAVAYGDDLVVSLPRRVDLTNLAEYYKKFFGMTVTTEKKDLDFKWVLPSQISFLKRSPKVLYRTNKVVGALDLDSMHDKIQWMRNPETFDQQMDSFLMELALHGPEIYHQELQRLLLVQPTWQFPPFELMWRKAKITCLE
nr:MAG: polyprotein [Picornaviridae sp.]